MEDYIIVVNRVEELQTIRDQQELELIFERARRTIIGGCEVVLVREDRSGNQQPFDRFSNEQDFEEYRNRVFRFL
ncbi:hypothetical protein HHL16_15745 [Pseudoflavitalea sp. G-6-1-2]|uniref:hypothetical protein n=1 Tax=Pseudoflavitalea sp. G-6-1-2 TaxID=2728841 RepID=UPI00146E5DCD|nr:hypothetical protein [Pseudoflavitalea sp. G-6-1-2]NML22337.1 hypothetical protein [Pseudoflavitalea sp. G-6-1-2]